MVRESLKVRLGPPATQRISQAGEGIAGGAVKEKAACFEVLKERRLVWQVQSGLMRVVA